MMHSRTSTRRAFTLTEALVAVIAIAIISVGLAAIFASVGDTVQRGRRVSAINQYAASIERRIRADLSNITRDGFLVIRNEYAGAGSDNALDDQFIPLSPEAPATTRLRRVDELLFFARGNFVSARGSLSPNADAPRAREARIYYGHGQKQLEGADGFFRPYLDDPNADPELGLGIRSGAQTAIGEANPNVYAGDWTLLRHATLLRGPSLTFFDEDSFEDERFLQLADNDLQINGQVAADSIFRSEAYWGEPLDTGNAFDDDFEEFSARGAQAPPTFASGIVDIATQSLPEIRRRVMGLAIGNNQLSAPGASSTLEDVWVETPSVEFGYEGVRSRWERTGRGGVRIGRPTSPSALYDIQLRRFTSADESGNPVRIVENNRRQSLVHLQHAWMGDALPAASNEITFAAPAAASKLIPDLTVVYRGLPVNGGQPANATEPASPLFDTRARMRYESVPPGYNADVFGEAAQAAFNDDREDVGSVLLAAARADQQMVTSSQFIPRCTEFIVEFSFGERYTPERLADLQNIAPDASWLAGVEGQLIWYGAPRPRNSGIPLASIRPDGNRPPAQEEIDPGQDPTATNPLDIDEQRLLERHLLADLIAGSLGSDFETRRSLPPPASVDDPLFSQLNRTAARVPTSFYFGYGDPRAVPVDDFRTSLTGPLIENTGFDINGDGYRDDIDGDGVYDDTWPWPRLLRITMSFADPVDQTVEDTFQFVVELPRNGDL